MKKLLALTVATLLTASAAVGCTPKTEPAANPAPAAAFKDGTYTQKGQPDERGWTPEITITVQGGKITAVKYDELAGMKKTQDKAYQENFKAQKNVDLVASYKSFGEALVNAQDIAKVDTITGATNSFESFKALVPKALETAKDGDKLKDGEYRAKGQEDERGWTPTLTITVKDGKIASAVYDEVSSKAFVKKSEDTAYQARFKEIKNVDLLDAYNTLQKSLIDKQDPSKVDAYAGATSARDSFVELATKALEAAK